MDAALSAAAELHSRNTLALSLTAPGLDISLLNFFIAKVPVT